MNTFTRKALSLIVCVCMVLSLGTIAFADGLTPGSYTTVVAGNSGDVTVTVTFSEGSIISVEIGENNETQGFGSRAIDQLPGQIVETQSVKLDAVSGATNTSNAILTAVKDCIAMAGGNVEDFMVDVDTEAEVLSDETIIYDTDIIVVGGGASGLAAAVEAIDQGYSVTVIEKNEYLGGMASGIEGVFGYGSQMQADANVELPSLFELVDEEMTYTNYRSDAVVWRNLFSTSGETVDWLQSLGIEFDRVDTYQGASLFPCFHWFPGTGGVSYVETMTKHLEDKGAALVLGAPAYELITDETGAVIGAKAHTETGVEFEIHGDAVVLCTGGLAANMELMQELTGNDTTYCMSQSQSVGDGYRMAAAVGAGTNDVCALQWPYVYGYDVMDDYKNDLFLAAGYQCLPIINQDGVRFFAEDLYTKVFTALVMNALSSQDASYVLFDQNTLERFESGEGIKNGFWILCNSGDNLPYLRGLLEEATVDGNGRVFKGETIAALAEEIGCEADALQGTVDRYNSFAANGVDEDFGKAAEYLYEIGAGPYYAVKLDRCYVTSVGGINIDAGNRVLTAENEPIPGLYSAGVDSCELYKETYNYQLSGGMMAYDIYSGRNAIASITHDFAK